MKTFMLRKRFSFIILCFFILSSCATDMKLARNDAASFNEIEVALQKTPDLRVETFGGLFFFSLGGIVPTSIGVHMLNSASRNARQNTDLPDFGKLVAEGFVDRVRSEIPDMSNVKISLSVVEGDFKSKRSKITFKYIDRYGFKLHWRGGLVTAMVANFYDESGKLIWKRHATYVSSDKGRQREIKEFLADNGKLLREEINYAANYMIEYFVSHFKGEAEDKTFYY